MKAKPLKKLTSLLGGSSLILYAALGLGAEPVNRRVEVPGLGPVDVPMEWSAQRIEQVLSTNLAFRVDAQTFKVSVVVSPKREDAPAAAVASPQPAPTQTGSSNPITNQGATAEDWGLFVVFLSVVALVVSIVLHLRRRSTTGTKPAPAPNVSVTPVQPQPLALYVLLNGNTQGPLSQHQVFDMVQQGQLLGETPAWKEGLADWKRLDQLVSLPAVQPVAAPSVRQLSILSPTPASVSSAPLVGKQTNQVQPAPLSSQANLTTVCRVCGANQGVLCKRDFLGFRRCACSLCGAVYTQPLTAGLRATYWVFGVWFAFHLISKLPLLIKVLLVAPVAFVGALIEQSFFIIFVVGAITALWKDARLKR